MTGPDHRQVVRRAVESLNQWDFDTFLSLLDADVTWTINWHLFRPFVGIERVSRLIRGTWSAFEERGYTMEIDDIVVEGNVVSEQAHGFGKLANGEQYANMYCRVWTFSGDRVRAVTEYMDTDLARAIRRQSAG